MGPNRRSGGYFSFPHRSPAQTQTEKHRRKPSTINKRDRPTRHRHFAFSSQSVEQRATELQPRSGTRNSSASISGGHLENPSKSAAPCSTGNGGGRDLCDLWTRPRMERPTPMFGDRSRRRKLEKQPEKEPQVPVPELSHSNPYIRKSWKVKPIAGDGTGFEPRRG